MRKGKEESQVRGLWRMQPVFRVQESRAQRRGCETCNRRVPLEFTGSLQLLQQCHCLLDQGVHCDKYHRMARY